MADEEIYPTYWVSEARHAARAYLVGRKTGRIVWGCNHWHIYPSAAQHCANVMLRMLRESQIERERQQRSESEAA
jgi:type III secretory pathway lipoprotein EscJ